MMTDQTVVPFAQPDAAAMTAHLEHLFDGFLDGAHDGMIELAWTNAEDGKLRHAEMFHTDDLDRIAQRAFEVNSTPGQNVYIGAALRKRDTFPGGRAEDEDYYCSTAYYADLDDEGVADAVTGKYRGCKPTLAVVTGRHPYKRVQLWWRLETPERDAEGHRAQCLALAIELAGDRTVVNPSRVMRLGGSIAWPRKAGRVIEKTEVITFKDGRPLVMMPGQLAKAFPPMAMAPLLNTPAMAPLLNAPVAAGAASAATAAAVAPQASQPPAAVVSPLTGRLRPSALIQAIQSGDPARGGWHNNMIRLVAHWVGRGWSDTEILNQAAGLTLSGWTREQTAQEMAVAIRGARAKWAKPSVESEFDPDTGEIAQPGEQHRALRILDIDEINDLQPPAYIIDKLLIEGGFSLIWGAPRSFKSFLALDFTMHMAYGQPWNGRETLPKNVLYIAGEGAPGFRKRIAAWRKHHGKTQTAPFYMLSTGVPLLDPNAVANLIAAIQAKQELSAQPFEQIVVDTVARAMVGGDENDAKEMGAFIGACDRIREAIGCAVLAVHHAGKNADLGPRGSTALPAAVDTDFQVDRIEGTDLVTVTCRKQKDDEEPDPFRLKAHKVALGTLGIGEESSLILLPHEGLISETEPQGRLSHYQVNQIMDEVQLAWDRKRPWSLKAQTREEGRYLPIWVKKNFPVSLEEAARHMQELVDNGFLTTAIVNKETKMKGLKVVARIPS